MSWKGSSKKEWMDKAHEAWIVSLAEGLTRTGLCGAAFPIAFPICRKCIGREIFMKKYELVTRVPGKPAVG
jgi:hypothetical protein